MRQAMGHPTSPRPCVGVLQPLIHSSKLLHRNVYYSVFDHFLQVGKGALSRCVRILSLTSAVYELLIHRVYYFRRAARGRKVHSPEVVMVEITG